MLYFDDHVLQILWDLGTEVKELKVDRVNSTMLLRALLGAKKSPLYNALLEQLDDMTFLPEMLEETYAYSPIPQTAETGVTQPESTQTEADEESTKPHITFTYNEETRTLIFDKDLSVLLSMIAACIQLDEQVDIWRFTAFFVHTMSKEVRTVLRAFSVKTELLEQKFTANTEAGTGPVNGEATQGFEIPQELKGFVTNLNAKFAGKPCDISGRNRECKQVWQTLLKHTKSNAVLLGDPGVGKTSIVVKMVHDILNHTCPKEFEDHVILSLDVAGIVAGTMYRGQAEQRFSALVDYLDNQPNIILFIDEIHLINGAGACREGDIDLGNTLKPILAGGNVKVIGATTQDEYEKYFSRDGALKRRFRPVYVKEPKMKEVPKMLQKSIETLSAYHGVSISPAMVDFVVLNAACFDNETCNPDRTKDLIDLSMVVAKQAGKTRVDKKSVLANFAYHLKKFAKMSDHVKRSTAYHEAGHCLVVLCSKELNNYDVIAVSIMPTDDYMGVTVYEYNDVTMEPTMEYLVDQMAKGLAGRVAEKMFTTTITAGASSDLEKTTHMAYNLVTKYGMWDEFSLNRIYTEEISSDQAKDQMNAAIDKLIERAMQRAEEILNANRESLELLVEALMKNGIVGPKDLKQLLKNIKKM